MYSDDKRIVVTLDAGGTNFVFGAVQGNVQIVPDIAKKSNYENLEKCICSIRDGFAEVISHLPEKPSAISFAFPGPADYPKGIIGGYVPNFPAFRKGVALADYLKEHFSVPVFINNDADLFVYGESLAGTLPWVNSLLGDAGRKKRYRNLLGYTMGTGFGFGFVSGGHLHIGDNACVETFCLRNKERTDVIAEDFVSAKFIVDEYERLSSGDRVVEPKNVFEIAEGLRAGNVEAAKKTFERYGMFVGDAVATAVSLIDGLVVLGGGVTGAKQYIMPSLISEMRSYLTRRKSGEKVPRLQTKVYNLEEASELAEFLRKDVVSIEVFGSGRTVSYNPSKKIGVCVSKIGAVRAVNIGAYSFALDKLDSMAGK